jgi:hypothetical protein
MDVAKVAWRIICEAKVLFSLNRHRFIVFSVILRRFCETRLIGGQISHSTTVACCVHEDPVAVLLVVIYIIFSRQMLTLASPRVLAAGRKRELLLWTYSTFAKSITYNCHDRSSPLNERT